METSRRSITAGRFKRSILVGVTLLLFLSVFFTSLRVNAVENGFMIPKDAVMATAKYNTNNTITVSGKFKDYPWLTGITILFNGKSVAINKKGLKSLQFTQVFSVTPSKTYKLYTIEFKYIVNFAGTFHYSPLILSVADPKYVFNVDDAFKEKTVASIREQAKKLTGTYSGNPFKSTPSAKSPYKTGAIQDAFLNDGLKITNFYRYIANLPNDLSLDAKLTANAQYGTVLLAKLGYLSHTPPQPTDMPRVFFDQAYQATSTSNLYQGNGNLIQAVNAFMDDSDQSNIAILGHRRWVLSPDLKYVGFGMTNNFSAMKVFDKSRNQFQILEWDSIAWPAKGYVPIDYFQAPKAWSVSINPQKYQTPEKAKIQVTLTNLNSKKVWKINTSMSHYTPAQNYMNVDTGNYGGAPAIIFRPYLPQAIQSGDKYQVNITGLKAIDGTSKNLTYEVWFFKL